MPMLPSQSARPKIGSAEERYRAGLSLLEHGNYDLAIVEFTESIKSDPSDIFPYFKRAVAYEKKGDRDNAIAEPHGTHTDP
jgi:Tfp pilus assembly protein PilF